MPSPARNASSNSDTADWDNAIGGLLFSGAWPFTPKIPPMAHLPQQATPQITPNPTTPGDSHPWDLARRGVSATHPRRLWCAGG